MSDPASSLPAELHVVPLRTAGWHFGYSATGRWQVVDAPHAVTITVRYVASLFNTAHDAAAALADARTSLWEWGRVTAGRTAPRFTAVLRNGQVANYDVRADGPVEYEVSVLYPKSADSTSVASAQRAMANVKSAARAGVHRFVARFSPSSEPMGTGSLPDVQVPPLGTGPVAKSPSLMSIDTPQVQPQTTLDAGAFRPQEEPGIHAGAARQADLAPAGAISRYARTATVGTGDGLYQTTALFGNANAARSAFIALKAANDGTQTLHSLGIQQFRGIFPRLTIVDGIAAWQGAGETILAVRYGNVIMVLADTRPRFFDAILLADRLIATIPTPLHADGTHIADAAGYPVRLAGLNWYGFEQQDFVVGGLDYKSYMNILLMMKQGGYNSIRLPFSQQLVESNPVVKKHLGANPELAGLHALDIMDRIIAAAGALGLRVILDNHRSEAGWSSEENGLWYTTAYPADAFTRDWLTVARRYAGADTVVGADLRNEPHGAARWGTGDAATDWKMAAESAGNAVLTANPNLLIIVEGVEFYGTAPGYWWGGNLMGVVTAPISLHFGGGSSAHSRLVYSAHDYGKDNCGPGCPWFGAITTYASLAALWDQYWGYIVADPAKPYAAPVWLGEFGTCNYRAICIADTTPGSQGQWFTSLIRYIGERDLSWSYWSANGTESTAGSRVYGALDWYGYFYQGWTQANPWLDPALRTIQQEDGGDIPQSVGTGPR